MHNLLLNIILSIGALCGATAQLLAAALGDPATMPATKRDFETILEDYQKLNAQVIALVGSPDDLLDPQKRDKIGQQAVPLLHRLNALADEISTVTGPAAQFGPQLRANVDPVLAMFADPAAMARLQKLAAGEDTAVALRAKAALLSAAWVRSNGDAATQTKLLDEVEPIAKANPQNDNLAELLWRFADARPATPEIRDRAKSIATTVLTGDLAREIKAQLEAEAKLATLVGQPLPLSAVQHTGEPFDAADWKGKVIIVDFFVAEWPPSQRNTLVLAKLYEKYHDKGVEFVGLCCDTDPAELARFLKENPSVKWPILYDAENPGVHAIAQRIGVSDPHTVIVIDKTGIVRSTDAREGLEKMIVKLLGE